MTEKFEGCDYETIGPPCQYGVPSMSPEGDYEDCGEPATHKVWWSDYNYDFMLVCKEHLAEILKSEELQLKEAEEYVK